MADARGSRRVLPAGRSPRHDGHDLQPHHRAGPRPRASPADQPVRADLPGNYRVEPGEDRPRRRDHLETRYRLRDQQVGLRHPRLHPSCAQGRGLRPLTQTSIRFVGHIGYHDYEGPATDLDERERLVRDLGPHDAMILRSHGLLSCGATIQQAFNTMYQLEMSCRAQVDAMAARTELLMPSAQILAKTAHLYQPGTRRPYGILEWPAMLRLLAAESGSSGYPPYWQ